jgi:hypothetical protein
VLANGSDRAIYNLVRVEDDLHVTQVTIEEVFSIGENEYDVSECNNFN